MSVLVKIDRRLCLTEDRSRLVPEGHSEARFLWAVPGDEVLRSEAERLGAVEKRPKDVDEPRWPAGAGPAKKAMPKPVTKVALPESNK